MKKINKKVLIAIISAVVAVGLVLAIVLPIVLRVVPEQPFSVPENKLPTEDKYALKKYKYDELHDVQTTLRSDVLNVTKRNLPRGEVQLLSDDFSLVYDSSESANTIEARYGELTETAGDLKTATISFGKYPSPSSTCDGTNAFTNGTMSGTAVSASDGSFYKYMLMTQGQHLAADAARFSKATASDNAGVNAEFKNWLKKHPSADAQYGAVLGENNAVEKEITLDPLYRSPHATGLYLPAGEAVTVKVEGLKPGERITVTTGYQNSLAWLGGVNNNEFNAITGGSVKSNSLDAYFTKADVLVANNKMGGGNVTNQSQWQRQNNRAPWVICDFTIDENKTYTIGNAFGGALHIGMGNCYSHLKVTITGAVETPHYILGVTTPEYFDQYLRQAPGVIAVLDTENGQLIGPTGEMGTSGYMRQVKTDEIDKLAMLWHSFLSVNESFTGGTYNRFNKVMFDEHVPAGAAVSLGNYSFAHPTSWFQGAMNYRGLLSSGTWGILHEIGHNHGAAYGSIWGFGAGREGEVRNNALTLLSYIMFCDIGTTVRMGGSPEHGEYANPYSVLGETLTFKGKSGDFDDGSYGYFQCLGMYANIMHSFGAEKFYELLYTYKQNSAFCSNKRADFAYRCSLIYGMNFRKYFNEFYCANITNQMFTEEQLAQMSGLPNYEPVSCYYAGGIDGVKTAGDYLVAFGEDLIFDLLTNTKSTLDTAESKGFEIISVDQPAHGKIINVGDGKYKYSFNKEYTGAKDEFSFMVKLSDGVIHKLTVYLRISYNGTRLTEYNDVQGKTLDEVIAETGAKQPDAVSGSSYSYIRTYNSASGKKDVRVLEFYWRAPKSGVISVSSKMDDLGKVYFGESFESLEELFTINKYINTFIDYGAVRSVQEGKFYAVKVYNLNAGGGGSAVPAIKYEGDEEYSLFDTADVFHPDFPLGETAETYIYEPEFMVSKKDNVKLSITGTDKSEWKVVKAPDNVHGGRIQKETMVDEKTGDVSILETDKWTWLIDGQAGTFLHTSYDGSYNKDYPDCEKISPEHPHEFIIDTSKSQQFNYFSVTTRNHANSYITDFELQISESPNGEWKTIATGDRTNYVNNVITLKFPEETGRYLRLLVKGTTGVSNGRQFSVLAEIDAGIKTTTQQVLPPTSNKFFATEGWKNSAQIATEPNGYLIAEKKNEKLVIKFKGESFAMYAATGKGFGSATVYLDGKKASVIDLNSDIKESRKLVFNKENLEDKEHTVEVITQSSAKVMVNVVGIPYNASLINASNIYFERALTTALIVFVLLFAAVTALVAVLVFVPKFRNLVFGNRFIQKLDNRGNAANDKESEITVEQVKQPVRASVSEAVKKEVKSVSKPVTVEKQQGKTVKEQPPKSGTKPTPAKATAKEVKPAVKTAAKPAAEAKINSEDKKNPKKK